jgi:hypothetical protein
MVLFQSVTTSARATLGCSERFIAAPHDDCPSSVGGRDGCVDTKIVVFSGAVYAKLGVRSRTAAVVRARELKRAESA